MTEEGLVQSPLSVGNGHREEGVVSFLTVSRSSPWSHVRSGHREKRQVETQKMTTSVGEGSKEGGEDRRRRGNGVD